MRFINPSQTSTWPQDKATSPANKPQHAFGVSFPRQWATEPVMELVEMFVCWHIKVISATDGFLRWILEKQMADELIIVTKSVQTKVSLIV